MRKPLFALIFAAAALAQPTPDQAARLESQLRQFPDDANARSQLIRLYFRDPQKTSVRVQHILWFVAHQPDAPVLDEPSATVNGRGESYDYLKRAWLSKIDEPWATASTLSKAANFFRPPTRIARSLSSRRPDPWSRRTGCGSLNSPRCTRSV
jgi:hypothetical protein